jgi:hypothetical protein
MKDIETVNEIISYICGYYERHKKIPAIVANPILDYCNVNVNEAIVLFTWLEANNPIVFQCLIDIGEDKDEMPEDDSSPANDHPGSQHPTFSHVESSGLVQPEGMMFV